MLLTAARRGATRAFPRAWAPATPWARAASGAAVVLPPVEELPEYWRTFFAEADACIAENFYGNLGVYRNAAMYGDPYVADLKRMGYELEGAAPAPAPFHTSMAWVFAQLGEVAAQAGPGGLLWPAKAFTDGRDTRFVPLGAPVPPGATPVNLLTPDTFVRMLAAGYFPIGEAVREHTNQSLCEHDLAHMAAFASSPRFMFAMRAACERVAAAADSDPRVATALQYFDSALSLRLYYTIEVFAEVPVANRPRLAALLEHPCDELPTAAGIQAFLLDKARDPAALHAYLARLYWEVFSLLNPLGGESRDVLNRRRKHARGSGRGSLYDSVSASASKFSRNSIFSLFMDAKGALEFARSNHADWERGIREVHAPFIGALVGTAQLSIEDWVLEAAHVTPRPTSKLYRYIHDSGFWERDSLLHAAFCSPAFDAVHDDSGVWTPQPSEGTR